MTILDWRHYDTLLLDMDGTVLDLAFDNYFWRELVPRSLARARQLELARARDRLFDQYAAVRGSLQWYCLDYWTAELGLDLRELKAASSQRVRFLPGAREFLAILSSRGIDVVLVTNAHEYTLQIKKGVAGLTEYFEAFVSAHELGFAKEQAEFWPLLQSRLGFDPRRTIFIDDSLPVLDAAVAFGIHTVFAVTRPDSRRPAADCGSHCGIGGIASLI